MSTETPKERIIYSFNLLKLLNEELDANINMKNYNNIKVNRNTIIKGICQCGEHYQKNFEAFLKKGGPYCKQCVINNQIIKKKETCKELYNEEFPMRLPEFKQKFEQTCIEKYGKKHMWSNKDVRETQYNTCIQKYGTKYPNQNEEVKQKGLNTFRTNYNCDNPMQHPSIRSKFIQTCRERYNADHFMHNAEISEKASNNAYKRKIISFPSGRQIILQGYEPQALIHLLTMFNENEIVTGNSNVPEVWYIGEDNKKHRYYTDFYIPKINSCIEIKSKRTFELNKIQTYLKHDATLDSGYNHEIWILNEKGEILEIIFSN